MDTVSRRDFLTAGTLLPLCSIVRAQLLGANDRIQIGLIGCGHRSAGHRQMLKMSAETDPNFDLRSVCDLWSVNRERAADDAQRLFGKRPRTFQYSEEMLADPDLDAVDDRDRRSPARENSWRRSCGPARIAIARSRWRIPWRTPNWPAMRCVASKQVAQMGSQWLSCPYQQRVREIDPKRQAGKDRLRSVRAGTTTARAGTSRRTKTSPPIRARDTDWTAVAARQVRPRPFDPRVYFEFRIFKDFSGGITDQWYSHGAGLAHFYLDTFIPDDTVSNGGIFAWHDVRENPDTFQTISTFAKNRGALQLQHHVRQRLRRSHHHPRHARHALFSRRRRQPAVVVRPRTPQRAGDRTSSSICTPARRSRSRCCCRAGPRSRPSSRTTT